MTEDLIKIIKERIHSISMERNDLITYSKTYPEEGNQNDSLSYLEDEIHFLNSLIEKYPKHMHLKGKKNDDI